MSEESLTSQDKEELKKRLELLQKEYERTAQRLQRAERREAVRKHVQSRISEHNRLLHINTSVTLEQSSSSSPEQLSSCSAPSESRSPSRSHRLRSKRSLLRLQTREKESDTEESQEKMREGMEERWRDERREMEGEREWTSEEKKDVEKGQAEEERKQEEEEERREQAEMMKDVLEKNEENLTPENHQSAAESSSVNQSPLTKLLEIHDPPAGQSAFRNSPSTSSDNSVPSNEMSGQSCSINNAEKSSDFLTSCTLIEGLPFPVEYYVRTTRRMASAHSSVDLDAVIQSQLSNGRGRRRASRGRVTSQPSSQKLPEKSSSRRCGQRGWQGRRRTRESDSSGQSESLDQSPCSLPQEESEPTPSPNPSSDPQLHLSCELSTDPHVYPIFRRRCGRASVSRSRISTRIKGSSQLLPSLTSLTQALRTKDFRNLSGLLTILDVQDFHLPDDEFGQLKLERLCSSCPNLDSLSCSSRFRKSRSTNSPEGGQVENKKVVLNSLPHAASLESLLPLTCPAQTQVEVENTDQSECEVTSQALDKMQEPVHRSITNQTEVQQNGEAVKHTPLITSNDPHTPSASRSLMLNLSMSLTSHTQIDHNSSLITLGATPNLFTVSPSSQLTPFLSMPDQGVASEQSQVEMNNGTPENFSKEATNLLTSPRVQTQGREVSEHTYSKSCHSNGPEMEDEAPEPAMNAEVEIQGCGITDERGAMEVNISPQEKNTEIPILTNDVLIFSESESQRHSQNEPEKTSDTEDSISGLDFHSQTLTSRNSPRGDISNGLNVETSALTGVSAKQRQDSEAALSLNLVQTSQTHRDAQSQHVELLSRGSLQKTHTLKALDGGCVLDVCLVRWPSEDWCVCVAGEWSVCVWKQNPGDQQWKLLYTWTFTQSVISLQGIPDSSALLCVCLGRLEITEARILYCPSTDSEFSQIELYKGALQAVLAVSDRRVTCCSAPGAHQNLQVFTLTQDGRMAETLSLVSSYETVQTLVMVEREKDALIGWTEHKSFLIWNMKSGQLLQTVRLEESISTATCLRGYSHRGVLCVLLQEVSACHEDTASPLFTLIATNPLTGKSLTLRTFSPASSPSERLVDGDVCESALVGVFQSGLTIWNLTGGVACVYANESAETCRLARWAGPNTLLTGYLSGDVHIYQFNPTENISD
ncbi:partner and localizer of BRCA2 isoform X2 [Hemibagrus wyckioides]|uniref:partner and localizer of BRCA2 isoform X2 n=1 Tax=Hemibagrus wyckioides TaxID=337641 RepID=UPI00266CDDA8|nr:partner and localizer of BRCA2 isoform X2 [Hemibagrus wyckioides]